MQSCPKRQIYFETNLFLRLPHILLKRFFDMKVNLKMLALFLSLKDNTEYICLKPTLNR